jgi:hypothetical protein
MFSLFLVSKPLEYIAALIFCEFANILNGKKSGRARVSAVLQ